MSKEHLSAFFYNTNLVSLSMAKELADRFEHKDIAKNHFMLTEGNIADEYVFPDKGYLRAFASYIEGNEITTLFHQ